VYISAFFSVEMSFMWNSSLHKIIKGNIDKMICSVLFYRRVSSCWPNSGEK